jgi:outer membrane lipoprotein-sorting protein
VKELQTAKLSLKDPGLTRMEEGSQISISNGDKMLRLDTTTKIATLIEYKRAKGAKKDAHGQASEMIGWLRKLADKKSESIGKKQIGDLEANGFRVEDQGFAFIIWANPKTSLPVLVEMPLRIKNEDRVTTFSDFQLDPELDDALFSLEPPEGYKLHKMEMEFEEGKPEENVVHLLRAYADKFDGKFPKSLTMLSTDWQTYFKQWRDKKPEELPEPEKLQFMVRATRVWMFLGADKDHGYKPEGVKLGDRDKIVFWYRPDKADKYRAVFGDLHVADVSADQLPEKPKK